jgi:hypothetical protein
MYVSVGAVGRSELPNNPVQYCNGRWISDFQYSARYVIKFA